MRPSPARLLLAFFSETERILPPGSLGRLIAALSRSEEHTSELQSQSNLVCRLLLEKKKIPHCSRTSSHYAEKCKPAATWTSLVWTWLQILVCALHAGSNPRPPATLLTRFVRPTICR